ncbi:RNA polymerase II elongation factor ELL2 [Scleropages formosus]|uniref:Si:ch211-13k12.2 n=1 Tax=Scleropages formosus TaxID=113540 RepID=A0A8C9S6B9_SCLFO|nr:RNA polymerase II elongation factor ELL3 [Scleropages formosus]
MAALKQEHRYGLSCGKINKNSQNKTLYHVKLTDTALRALEAYQNLKGSLPNQPSICFKENQGYIKIPAVSADPHGALRVFSFYLDKPQASFDCIHQYVSSDGREQLECQGSIQDKITVCATDDSYQMTRERMSQVEKDILSRSAIEIKPGPTYQSKYSKLQRKLGPSSGSDGFSRYSPNNKRVSTQGVLTQKPLRDRVIHLLALKPYRKPELLLWLERERASPRDKVDLGSVLEEVAKQNPKDQSFTLRDEFYRHVQRDWPGYQEEEKQFIHRLLARKLQPTVNSSQSKGFQPNPSMHKTSGESPSHLSPVKNPAVKRPVPSELENQTHKKPRVLGQCFHPHLSSEPLNPTGVNTVLTSLHPSLHAKTESQSTSNHVSESQNALLPRPKFSGSSEVHKPERVEQPPAASGPKAPGTNRSVGTEEQQLPSSQHKKKKSKKHREKERERVKDSEKSEWLETSPDQKHNLSALNEQESANTPVSPPPPEELPDYLLKYSAITDPEQRQKYKEDFCAEYDEYRDLHSRIQSVTEVFVQLGSKIKTLSPGSQEYKIMEDQILEKYRKYKKKCPGYREEKKRCEYLHQKLARIKGLIMDYDQAQMTS